MCQFYLSISCMLPGIQKGHNYTMWMCNVMASKLMSYTAGFKLCVTETADTSGSRSAGQEHCVSEKQHVHCIYM